MIGWFLIRHSIMKDIPDGHQHLAGDGDLYFHAVLASLDTLPIRELCEKGVFCPGSPPSTFYHGLAEELVSMCNPA